jgi:hypothetical protein
LEFQFVGNYDHNSEVLQRVPMQKGLSYVLWSEVEEFDFFTGDIFPLWQLKNVLLSINQFHCLCIMAQSSYISCFKPTIFCYRLVCELLRFVISKDDSMAAQPNLSPWGWISAWVLVFTCVSHFRYICQFELKAGLT